MLEIGCARRQLSITTDVNDFVPGINGFLHNAQNRRKSRPPHGNQWIVDEQFHTTVGFGVARMIIVELFRQKEFTLIAAILQARMSSSRFPGKVLEPILGRPMICRQLERVRQSRRLDAIIVATSTDPSDDPIARTVMSENVQCFRGDLDDVLDRVYRAALSTNSDHVVRLTADCPLVDARIIDALIDMHLAEQRDYSSNFLERRYPDGIDAEIISIEALEVAWRESTERSDREHVTPYLYRHSERFNLGSLRCKRDLAALRWTVDHREDLDFVTKVFGALYPESENFSMWDIVELLERRPELSEINSGLSQYAS